MLNHFSFVSYWRKTDYFILFPIPHYEYSDLSYFAPVPSAIAAQILLVYSGLSVNDKGLEKFVVPFSTLRFCVLGNR